MLGPVAACGLFGMGACAFSGLVHAKGGFVKFKDGFFFGHIIRIAFAQGNQLTQDLGVITTAFGLGHHLFLLIDDIALFGLELLVAFDELAQFFCGDVIGGI